MKELYAYESSPLDYWEKWIPLPEFGEFLENYIKNNPKQQKSYYDIWQEVNSILLVLGKHISGPRGEFIHIYLRPSIDIYQDEGSVYVGIKEDNNGTCVAFTYNRCLIDGKVPLPHDFGDEWRERILESKGVHI